MNSELLCPITMELLEDPVQVPCCGRSLSRQTLKTSLEYNSSCPMCKSSLEHFNIDTAPKNIALAYIIEEHKKKSNKENKEGMEEKKGNDWEIVCKRLVKKDIEQKFIGQLSIICNSKESIKGHKTMLLMVVDKSGSMSGNPINQVKYSLNRMMYEAKKNDSLIPYIMCYDNYVSKLENIETLIASGGTSFSAAFDGIIKIMKEYNNKVNNYILVFLTDGECGTKTSQERWINDFKTQMTEYCTKDVIIHTVGFGRSHDFQFLDNIRKQGTKEGSYRYADPNEDTDILSSKINSVIDTIVASSIIPLNIKLNDKIIETELMNYKAEIWLSKKPESIEIILDKKDDKEHKFDCKFEEISDAKIWIKYYSYQTDKLLNETIEFERQKDELESEDLEIFGELLLRRCNAVLKQLSLVQTITETEKEEKENTKNRLEYTKLTVKQIMEGKIVDKLKLTDLKYEGNFKTKTREKKPSTPISYVAPYEPTYIKPVHKYEPEIYSYRKRRRLNTYLSYFKNIATGKNNEIEIDMDKLKLVDNNGNNALGFASFIGRCTLVNEYLKITTNELLNNKNIYGETALDLALLYGYWYTAESLLKAGAKINLSSNIILNSCLKKRYFNTAKLMKEYNLVIITKDLLQYFSSPEIASWIMDNVTVDNRTRDLMTIQKGIVENLSKFSLDEYKFSTYPEILQNPTDGHLEVIEYMLKNNIVTANEIWEKDGEIIWALFIACEKGNLRLAEILIDYYDKGEINKQNNKGTTCLWIASCNKHIDIVLLLLSKGANPNITNLKGELPLIPACQKGSESIANMLITSGTDITIANKNGDNALLISCRTGQYKILEMLLEECKKKNILGTQLETCAKIDGFNPLLASVELNKIECIDVLYKYGAYLEFRTSDDNDILPGGTSMHLACFYGRLDSVIKLYELGANINTTTINTGKTPLHFAIENKHIDIVRYLMDKDVMQIPDKDGHMPIYYASIKGNEEIYNEFYNDPLRNLIIKLAYSRRDKTKSLKIIEEHAESLGCYDYEDILNIDCGNGMNLLSLAILRGDKQMIELLEKIGASYDKKDNRGLSAKFWKDFIDGNLSNAKVHKITDIIRTDIQNKVLLDVSRYALEYEHHEYNDSIISKMNYGYGKKIKPYVLKKLEKAKSGKYSLLSFIDKINKFIASNTNKTAQMLWDAKVNVIAKLATSEAEIIKPVHMLAIYLFTMENKICNEVNNKLHSFSETNVWTQYIYCLYQGLNLLPNYEKECYRQIDALFYMPIGTVIDWNYFSITTSDWGNINLSNTSTTFIIKSKTGKHITKYSRNPQNNEVIFMPGSKFKVVDYYVNNVIVFGQKNIRQSAYKAKDLDIQKVTEGKSSLIVEIHEI